jgi:hypothetical protein
MIVMTAAIIVSILRAMLPKIWVGRMKRGWRRRRRRRAKEMNSRRRRKRIIL